VVNTDVIGNCLSPRWLPWTQRAFVFNIAHPSSDVFVGVFDFDPEASPLQQLSTAVSDVHDSIGRVVIKSQKFMPNTEYVLQVSNLASLFAAIPFLTFLTRSSFHFFRQYPLYYGELEEHRKKPRGTLTIRLRLDYPDMRKALLAGMRPPDQSVVSVARKIDYATADYTVEGVQDDKAFSLSTLTGYVEEVQSYKEPLILLLRQGMMSVSRASSGGWVMIISLVGHFIDVLYCIPLSHQVWLWRGHYKVVVAGKTYHLPLHSMTVS